MSQVHATKRDNEGLTALMRAAKSSNQIAFEALIEKYERKHLNIKSKGHKKTALHIAADKCNKKMFKGNNNSNFEKESILSTASFLKRNR